MLDAWCLMHARWFMPHGLWLIAWPVSRGNTGPGHGSGAHLGHEPWAMSLEPWTIKLASNIKYQAIRPLGYQAMAIRLFGCLAVKTSLTFVKVYWSLAKVCWTYVNVRQNCWIFVSFEASIIGHLINDREGHILARRLKATRRFGLGVFCTPTDFGSKNTTTYGCKTKINKSLT